MVSWASLPAFRRNFNVCGMNKCWKGNLLHSLPIKKHVWISWVVFLSGKQPLRPAKFPVCRIKSTKTALNVDFYPANRGLPNKKQAYCQYLGNLIRSIYVVGPLKLAGYLLSPEGGGNPSQFPKDMLYPCHTGRNDRTAQQVGWPKARVWRRVAACRADIARATVSSQTRLQQRISLSAGTTQLDLSSTPKSCLGQRRPSGKSGKQDANAEDRQPMQAALADKQPSWW